MSEDSLPTKKSHKGRKIFGIVFGVIVVLLVAVTLIANAATKAPLAASDNFLNAMQAQNSVAAYELFSTEAKKTVTPAQFEAIVKQVGPILNTAEKVTNKKVDAKTGQAATAEITYEIKGTDGLTYSLIVNLTKEADLWKVLNFDSKKK